MSEVETFVIVLAAEPSTIPVMVRLRQLLKTALRCFRLRCISIREADHDEGGYALPIDHRATESSGKPLQAEQG